MSAVVSVVPAATPVLLTANAIGKIRELLSEENSAALKLRIYVTGGGCSGFSYGFAFEEGVAEDDNLFHQEDVGVVVDPMSLGYLAGAEVDFEDGLEGARFIIRNPNAKTTCGCGSSFSV
ncbi:MAG: iron-sulfur cluster insertion protein ErpA [Porticoccaceae bacterium]|jgi:iron-sulfur cluster insertion protein